jgi:hypothetical protein
LPAGAANFTWNGNTGNWSDPTQWAQGVPANNFDTDLLFLGSGSASYTSTNDIAGTFSLNSITLNSSSTASSTIAGSGLSFVTDTTASVTPSITQSGSGAFTISNPLTATNALTLGGAGTGVVALGGVISGSGGLSFTGGNWQFTNAANTFTGGLSVGTGSFLELIPAATGNQAVNLTPGATGYLGSNVGNTSSINGGTLKVTTRGTGGLTVGGFTPTFGPTEGLSIFVTRAALQVPKGEELRAAT